MIKFRKVRFKNFISYGNYFTEIWLDYKPTTVLIGESGSGKSSVTDAISFALFGKPFRPINKAQLINSVNGSDCLVEIEFDIGKNHYLIKRGIKPNIFEIFCNDVLVNQDSHSRDYQDYLERHVLNMNFRTFTQIVVLGAANFTPFMQMKPNDRRLLVEDLLDIQIFSTMSVLLKERISNTKNAATQNGMEIQIHKDKISLYNKYIEDLKRDKERQIQENEAAISASELDISNDRETIKNHDDEIKKLEELVVDEKTVVEKMNLYAGYQKDIESNLKKIKKELAFYETNQTCPTCDRAFEESYKENIILERRRKSKEFEVGIAKIEGLFKVLEERSQEINKVKKEIGLLEKKIAVIETHISSMDQYADKIRQENAKLKSHQKDTSEEMSQLQQLNEQFAKLEKDKEKLSHAKLIHEIAANLLKDGGIKTRIIKQYLPVINKLVNRFLTSMNFYVTFEIDENFNETIRSRGRDDFTYSCFSEGERQRLDIAILLTWRTIAIMKNSIKTNLLFIDELLDSSLDQSASENIIELLNNEPILKKSNIFVISHKTNMMDRFTEYIKFEKIKNFSRVIP
jgi:DNA repair exonuclease SbcCD ATPase subunit